MVQEMPLKETESTVNRASWLVMLKGQKASKLVDLLHLSAPPRAATRSLKSASVKLANLTDQEEVVE